MRRHYLILLSACCCFLPPARAVPPAATVRVFVSAFGRGRLVISAPGALVWSDAGSRASLGRSPAGSAAVLEPGPEVTARWDADGGAASAAARALRVEAEGGQQLSVQWGSARRVYPGALEIRGSGGSLRLVNEAPLEE